MPNTERGTPAQIPAWWLAEVAAAIESRGWQHVDVARRLLPPRHQDDKRSLNTASVKVSRFMSGKNQTVELATAIGEMLGVLPFAFTADTKEQAMAMAELQRDPAKAARDVAVARMLTLLARGMGGTHPGVEAHSHPRSPPIPSPRRTLRGWC